MKLVGMASLVAVLPACLALESVSAVAQTITDGDTLKQDGVTYRLGGIDAPEAKEVCPDGWPAGSLTTTRLQALTAG
jgi:endonuclease YncB( thermonuclease family)